MFSLICGNQAKIRKKKKEKKIKIRRGESQEKKREIHGTEEEDWGEGEIGKNGGMILIKHPYVHEYNSEFHLYVYPQYTNYENYT